jgi:mannitol/fructose-specific phosphotransferase system IIA component (Ntr-type)
LFRQLTKTGSPVNSIVVTLLVLAVVIITLDPTGIAKLASAFQLLLFSFVNLGVIVMRESKIQSYDPGYKSPLYPWMQIVGIFTPFFFIVEMGAMSILFSVGLILVCTLWYLFYARKRAVRSGAIYHIFERLGRQRNAGLDSELRGILKEKGLRDEDPFNEIVSRSLVIDLNSATDFDRVVDLVSEKLNKIIPLTSAQIKNQIMEGTLIGATPVTHGVALPHFRTDRIEHSEMVLVRCKEGIKTPLINPLTHQVEDEQSVSAVFFLISPENNPTQHLRILAQIAGRVDDDNFASDWEGARDEQDLREALLHDERFISICVEAGSKTEGMINKQLRRIYIPKGCLVAMLRRGTTVIVPGGDTLILEGDRLTVIGSPESIIELKNYYFGNKTDR